MGETLTHARGTDAHVNPITGETPGIKEIMERRAAGEMPDAGPAPKIAHPTTRPDDDTDAAAAREVASLRTRVADAEARATEEQRGRLLAEQQRNIAVQGAEDTGFTAINTALNAATREKETLQGEMKSAGEAGDFGRVGELSAQLGELGATIRDLQQGKSQAEADRSARINAPPPRQQPPQISASSDTERTILRTLGAQSRDAFLASRTPQTQQFLRQNPEFFTDRGAFDRMTGAEALARGRGYALDSPEYFATIKEVALGQTTQPRGQPVDRSVAPGAAPSREAPGPTGRRTSGGDVFVSADDKKVAEWMGVDPVEYVTERDDLQTRGMWPYRRR